MDAAATMRKDILLMLIEDSLRQADMQDFRTKFLTISKLTEISFWISKTAPWYTRLACSRHCEMIFGSTSEF
jgi:hypothetical protein